MGLINREKNPSEQREVVQYEADLWATGVTKNLFVAPYPVTLEQVKYCALGLSGAATHKLQIGRFIVGAGATAIDINAAAALVAIGTSGLQGASLPASGSSLLNLQAGDRLMAVSAGTDAAIASIVYTAVVKKTQDILSYFGTSVE